MKNELSISGDRRLSGTHRVYGNKNAALPMLAATLLTDEPVTLENLPLIDDVLTTLDLLRAIGAEVSFDREARRATIRTRNIAVTALPADLCAKVRATILFAALGANGESTIQNAQSIDRGYEDVVRNLGDLGAAIERRVG